ncbi:MAG: 5-oxoprolinase subunit PxpA [Paracoccaceae bacterium]|nr:5-oxoprolinase subunit PxpA [Paracoccaceae bacterium]
MTLKVDLNADMGESFGQWEMGNDAALLKVVTSANIACGFHAGDPDVMFQTMRLALENNVGIGAHPGFADLQGFGRRRLALSSSTLSNLVTYQLGAAQAMARAAGGEVQHFKLHGALANWASQDADVARCCYQAVLTCAPDLKIFVLAATEMERVVREMGCSWSGEIFADRAYNEDATLVDRSLPGAVIIDPNIAAQRILDMVSAKAIISNSGKHIPARIDTVCLHGDGASALAIAHTVRETLLNAGISVQKV